MKIVHLIFSLNIGGSENLLVDIANEQAEKSEVVIAIVKNKYNLNLIKRISDNIKVKYLSKRKSDRFDPLSFFRFWHFLLKFQPQVIHCHDSNCIKLIPFFKNKAVITVHSANYILESLKKYRAVYSISESIRDDIQGKSSIKTTVVYNGIDFDKIDKRENYSINKDGKFKVIQLGRLMHIKGQDMLINCMDILIKKHNFKNIKIDFIGEGEQENNLKLLVKQLKLEEYINFVGAQDRVWVYKNLSKYNVLVQPSRLEGFGLTVLEGIAAKIPVVAYNIDGPSEIMKDLPSCFLAKSNDSESLAENLIKALDLFSSDRIREYCNYSYGASTKRFSIKLTVSKYMELYKKDIQ